MFLEVRNMDLLFEVKKTTKKIVKQSKKVRINEDKIKELARIWKKEKVLPVYFPKRYHFLGNSQETSQYLFFLDSINFSFFAGKGERKWRKNNLTGYFALSFALKKEIAKILDINFFKNCSFSDLRKVLGNIPLLPERLKILRENSKILIENFDGKIENLIKKSNHQAENLILLLVKYFPSFRDMAIFEGKKVYFLKRAQIFCADLYQALKGKDLGKFKDIERLTAFADYKIPQILHFFGILEYSKELEEKIKNKIEIKPNSKEEIEIRANTIWAVEYFKDVLRELGMDFYSFQIDNILWEKSQKIKINFPHHITRTINY